MEPLGAEGIHFLDSGNYHYVTKLWLDQVKEPFDLLVLDHHTDLQQPMFGDILSCGGLDSGLFGGESLSEPGFFWQAHPVRQ